MRGPLRVEGRNNKIVVGKGPNFWKPRIDAPPSMRPRAEKSECKEGRTPRIVGGGSKLKAVDPGGAARITCWVGGGYHRQRLRECPRGRGATTRDGDESLVSMNQRGRRVW